MAKYEDEIAKLTDTQLIYEQAIINKKYKIIYKQKKNLEEEFEKRLGERSK